jgi:CBS domain-containing protein
VFEAMQTEIHKVEAADPLETVFTGLAEPHAKSVLVTESGRLLGLLTADSVAAFLMLQNAAKGSLRNKQANAA